MDKQIIQFGGMTRIPDDAISPDGDMMELINVKSLDGELHPVSRPIALYNSPLKILQFFVHHFGGNEYMVIRTETQIGQAVFDSTGKNITGITSFMNVASTVNVRIHSIGATLLVICDGEINYLQLKNGSYTYLGNQIPVPNLHVSFDCNESTYPFYNRLVGGEDKTPYRENFFDATVGYVEEKINTSKSLYGTYLLRYALRLYNGDYIYPSMPIIIAPKGTATYCSSVYWYESSSGQLDGASSGYKIQYCTPKADFSFSDYSNWKDIVVSVDFFISPRIYPLEKDYRKGGLRKDIFVAGNHVSALADGSSDYSQPRGEDAEYHNRYGNVAAFYKIGSINIADNITPNTVTGVQFIDRSNEDIKKNLTSYTRLEADESSFKKIKAKASYVYNSRLHLGDIVSTLYKERNLNPFRSRLNGGGIIGEFDGTATPFGANTLMDVYVELNTQEGVKFVKHDGGIFSGFFQPCFFYPDARATRVHIAAPSLGSTSYRTYPLKASEFFDYSYYIAPKLEPLLNDRLFPSSLVPQVSLTENLENIVKVSALQNPFLFPVENTYTIGSANIVGFCSNTTAISEGQFGQYPLLTFSKEGIYALQTGTGSVAYSAIAPLSREVCINPDGIIPIDGAILFPSKNGLILLEGNRTVDIAAKLKGDISLSVIHSDQLQLICENTGDLTIHTMSEELFREYLQQAKLAYNYNEKELIVSNSRFNFSYVYNFNSQNWHKVNYGFNGFFTNYPNYYATELSATGTVVYDLFNPDYTDTDVFAITRPLKLGGAEYKKIFQMSLRGYFEAGLSTLRFRDEEINLRGAELRVANGLYYYILASDDNVNYSIIHEGVKRPNVNSAVTSVRSKRYKYFIVVISGRMRTRSKISYSELIYEQILNKRLR